MSLRRFYGPILVGSGILASCAYGCLAESAVPGAGSGDSDASVHLAGCTGPSSRVAPGGYYTSGATVCTADGKPHLFHGVDRPSLEWSTTGDQLSAADFANMRTWNTNVVRIALNQDFWLSSAAQYDAQYAGSVDQAVQWAEAAGIDVILDLHWSDRGDLTIMKSGQQTMADTNSKEFWKEVASTYKNDGHVLFELYNEPHDVAWSVWLNGGPSGGFTVVGMQELYNTVRATGANNVVIAGGLDYAYNLAGVASGSIQGFNIMYATHPYNQPGKEPSGWEGAFGYLETNDVAPVIATEFGDGSPMCTGAWDEQLIAFADAHQMSWTAWAWYPGGCSFPSLISDWTPTLTVQGQAVHDALLKYPPSNNRPDASLSTEDAAGDDGSVSGEAAVGEAGDGGGSQGDGSPAVDGPLPDSPPADGSGG
jgi:hypothetical protein